ncbi:oxidation resistance protein 1 [Mortierella sp. AD031]|nr:oxidation resistance protein 1 [Mortierella sp. AD031]
MIPRKAKQAVLSLVTTEQSKYGPSRSTQSTVHGGDWGEPAVPAAGGQYQGIEPNSASSGQDPWMMVTGSGSSYVSNINTNSAGLSTSSGMPSGIGTPLTVREEQLNRMPALQLLERNADTDPVLDVETAHQIRLELPRKLRNATKWNLVYSSDQHGISMTTLYHRCKGKGPMILALKDTTDAVFGAFVTEDFKPNLTYYGTGECFLWNVTTMVTSPQPASSPLFSPSPMPSPSPLQLSSSVTTPARRSPSPPPLSTSSSASQTTGTSNNSSGNGGDRRYDLFLAMNDRLSTTTTGRSPSPLSVSSPLLAHLEGSPSNSPALRPSDATSTSAGNPVRPNSAGPPTSGGRKKKQKVVQFWKWTGKNDYMILSEPGFIGLGGGDGKFGLWIHSDLERGHSARCATFDNEPLAAACKHPIRHLAGGAALALPSPVPVKIAAGETPGHSRSSSPKDDKEEFYCQTVEIWSMVL